VSDAAWSDAAWSDAAWSDARFGPMQPGRCSLGRCSVRLFRDRRVAGSRSRTPRRTLSSLSSACSTRLRWPPLAPPAASVERPPNAESPRTRGLTGTWREPHLPHGLSRVKLVVRNAEGRAGTLVPWVASSRRHSRRLALSGPAGAQRRDQTVAFLSQTAPADRRQPLRRGVADAASARTVPWRLSNDYVRCEALSPDPGHLVSLHVLSVPPGARPRRARASPAAERGCALPADEFAGPRRSRRRRRDPRRCTQVASTAAGPGSCRPRRSSIYRTRWVPLADTRL